MTEYPRKCTRQEAIDCVKAGGVAVVRLLAGPDLNPYPLLAHKGEITFITPEFSRFGVLPIPPGDDIADYRICSPGLAPQPVTYSTAEAIAELYGNKPGEVEFTGSRPGCDVQLRLFLDLGGDVSSTRCGLVMGHIPNVRWSRESAKPKLVTGEVTILHGQNSGHSTQVFDDIRKMCQLHPTSRVRITYTVEAID